MNAFVEVQVLYPPAMEGIDPLTPKIGITLIKKVNRIPFYNKTVTNFTSFLDLKLQIHLVLQFGH